MSGLLESESESESGTEDDLFADSIVSTNLDAQVDGSRLNNVSNVNSIENRLEQYSRRLSLLGLEVEHPKEGDVTPDYRIDITIEDRNENSVLVEGQNMPATTSLILENIKRNIDDKIVNLDDLEDNKLKALRSNESQIDKKKIQIRFQAIGNVLPINPNTCTISTEQPFATVILFVKRKLKMKDVYCYVNNSFAPNPQQNIGDLWDQFKIGNALIVSYCATVAFG
ncbi:hypothetical protein TPHA_0B02660 [Tetrapisispora phaffii CBS 4417]|uniref:Ubiquitin-like protein ATG12 n=1 Tax=Tetrapisispora phaffii (strain ATCC 24235 / CBS 4417 / NBRC 1672 / NRRL Y-8282 / UCD 70-5) TaxID=1071381 RepID=G8BPK8_TETPH|nr:hypothetical protein TPHA_0B02660 [Tetrapisispora phaffii CBS 4417]CCE61939.1 hypothetical protein TPHA_0B02660 [Tetrapisispora phaffii CBS 4417]